MRGLKSNSQLELYGAHTLCTPNIYINTRTYVVDDLYLYIRDQLCIVGMVDGCGSNDQQKCTIHDSCKLCHSILSALKPVFAEFDRFVTLIIHSGT